jgi:hypothetical protein
MAQRLPFAPLHWQARFYYTPQFTSWIYPSMREAGPHPDHASNPVLDYGQISGTRSVRFPVASGLTVRKADVFARYNQIVINHRIFLFFIGWRDHFNGFSQPLACSWRLAAYGHLTLSPGAQPPTVVLTANG